MYWMPILRDDVPYEVPQYSERRGNCSQCDMCSQRLAVGEALRASKRVERGYSNYNRSTNAGPGLAWAFPGFLTRPLRSYNRYIGAE